jgi:hypothetical protein
MAILAAVLGDARLARALLSRAQPGLSHPRGRVNPPGQSRAVAEESDDPLVRHPPEALRPAGRSLVPRGPARGQFDLAEDVELQVQLPQPQRSSGTLDVGTETSGSALASVGSAGRQFAPSSGLGSAQRDPRRFEGRNRLWIAQYGLDSIMRGLDQPTTARPPRALGVLSALVA